MKKLIEDDKRLGQIDDYEDGDGVAMFVSLAVVVGIIFALGYIYLVLTL